MSGPLAPDVFVETRSCYVAICDEGSLANRPGFWDAEWNAAGLAAREARQDDCWRLFHFNDRLMWLAQQGEMLAWTLLFDGVFRAVVDRSPAWMPLQTSQENLGAEVLSSRLLCPTGRLLITCVAKLGTPQKCFLEVEPGAYVVAVQRDEQQELAHSLIDCGEYPAGAGPDWRIGITPA